jgi:hypothetical protein
VAFVVVLVVSVVLFMGWFLFCAFPRTTSITLWAPKGKRKGILAAPIARCPFRRWIEAWSDRPLETDGLW